MTRMTENDRTRYAKNPDQIPQDTQCDRCAKMAVARGTDGHRAFAYCADDMLAVLAEERAARPSRAEMVARVNNAIAAAGR